MDFSKPLKTRVGYPVRILCTDRKDDARPVVGLVLEGDQELLKSWTADGVYCAGRTDVFDLVQVPQPRKHAELIKRWAGDASMRIKWRQFSGWIELDFPDWDPGAEYEEILPGDPLY